MRVIFAVCVRVPEVAVTVIVYVPGVVPGLVTGGGLVPPPPPPPHANTPALRNTNSPSNPSMLRHFRRLAGTPIKSRQARAAPPSTYHGISRSLGRAEALVDGAVVLMVRVAVPAPAPVIFTGVVAPKLKVGESCAPEGPEVIEAVNATLPVNPPLGVIVTVEVLPDVAPGEMVTAVPVIVRPGGVAVETVTYSKLVEDS